jgi:hypothetical protein
MTTTQILNTMPQYQVPATPQATLVGERSESAAVKEKEAVTGKDAAVPVSNPGNLDILA